jgi:hypothetical protein
MLAVVLVANHAFSPRIQFDLIFRARMSDKHSNVRWHVPDKL